MIQTRSWTVLAFNSASLRHLTTYLDIEGNPWRITTLFAVARIVSWRAQIKRIRQVFRKWIFTNISISCKWEIQELQIINHFHQLKEQGQKLVHKFIDKDLITYSNLKIRVPLNQRLPIPQQQQNLCNGPNDSTDTSSTHLWHLL